MPWIEGPKPLGINASLPDPTPEYEPSFIDDIVPAAFRIENTIGSFLSDSTNGRPDYLDPDFDPIDYVPEGLESFARDYAFANSRSEVDAITRQIEREQEDRATLAAGGLAGVAASIAAGILDPINLIPIGGTAYRTYRTGGRILDGALSTARAGFVGSTASEAALLHTQETRTYGEAATNIAAGTFLAGVLGGGMGALAEAAARGEGKAVADILAGVERDLSFNPGNLSAAASNPLTLAQEGIKGNAAVDAALKVVGQQDPTLRLLQSKSIESRRIGQQLFETPLTLEKNQSGIATPRSVEAKIKNAERPLYNALKGMDDLYVQYALGRSKRFGDVAVLAMRGAFNKGAPGRKLTPKEFRVRIGQAMRRGDAGDEIAEINQAAAMFRRDVFEPLKQEAIAAKLLPEDVSVDTAVSYLNRVYDVEKLSVPAHRARFIDVTAGWLARRRDEAVARLEERARAAESEGAAHAARDAADDAQAARDKFDAEQTDAELRDVAMQILDRIVGSPIGRLPYDVTVPGSRSGGRPGAGATAKPLHRRAFLIPDEEIEEFLESDIEVLAKIYTRSMAPDVTLAKTYGDVDMTNEFDNIRRDYARLMDAAAGDAAKTSKLRDAMNADLRDLDAIRQRLRGTYGLPADPKNWGYRVGRGLRQLNFVTLLGGMTLSAISDIARPVMVHGFGRVFRDAIGPLVTNLRGVRLAAQQVRDLGGATDMLMNSRMQALGDIGDEYGRYSKFERGLGAVADTFGMATLMAPWNTAVKQIAGVLSQARILRAVRAEMDGTITPAEAEYLRSAGIGVDDARFIDEQFRAHGQREGDVLLPNALEWDNPRALEAFESALKRDIRRIIVTPGQDAPLAATGAWGEGGRLLYQFKSFAIASTQRTLLSGLQQADMAALNGLWLSVALGMLSYAAKSWDAGREPSDDWKTWVKEGVDRSGVAGWLFEVNNMAEKATRGRLGISALLGGEPMSRYASRSVVDALLGPSIGTAVSAAQAVGSASDAIAGEPNAWRAADTHAVRRLLPYNNLIVLRRMFDKAEIGINQALGAPGKTGVQQ